MKVNTWIFQTAEELDAEQQQRIEQKIAAFMQSWTAHKIPLTGRFRIEYGRFIIIHLPAESEMASGCSIDAMRKNIYSILQDEKVRILEAEKIFYRINGGISYLDFRDLEQELKRGKISGDTIVFDISGVHGGDFSSWEKPLKETWMNRYL